MHFCVGEEKKTVQKATRIAKTLFDQIIENKNQHNKQTTATRTTINQQHEFGIECVSMWHAWKKRGEKCETKNH